jgi:uncharacterized membrane-anchored protein YitT (DUF2179 family)
LPHSFLIEVYSLKFVKFFPLNPNLASTNIVVDFVCVGVLAAVGSALLFKYGGLQQQGYYDSCPFNFFNAFSMLG